MKYLYAAVALVALTAIANASGNGNQPAHVKAWHNTGDGHQANNNAGDTAKDRHNFGNDTAGKSDQNPTAGSAQDDFSDE